MDNATGKGNVTSVSTAVDSYAQDVSQASQILSEPTESDQTVIVLTRRLTTDFAHHEQVIAEAETRAPSPALTMSVRRADQSVQTALAVAVARANGSGQAANPILVASGDPAAGVTASATVGVASRSGLVATAATPGSTASSPPRSVPPVATVAAPKQPAPGGLPGSNGGHPPQPPPSGGGAGGHARDNDRHHPVAVDHWVFKPKWVPLVHPTPPSPPAKHLDRAPKHPTGTPPHPAKSRGGAKGAPASHGHAATH